MKKVSSKVFFTVVWRGICQAVRWFFGLFGYKREGKFAHCVWGLFALSSTVIVTIIAGVLVYALSHEYTRRHRGTFCDGEHCSWKSYLSNDVAFHDHGNGKGEIINVRTGEKTLTGVEWISNPIGEKDSLVVFSDGSKRGYFSRYTGKVIIPAKYEHAWVFSDGIASVEENGVIKFIDGNDKQVFDRTFGYNPNNDGYVFHGGYCIIDSNMDNKYGLMNAKGKTVVPEMYTRISVSNDQKYWALTKDKQSGVFDSNLKPVVAMMGGNAYINDDCIEFVMSDNTIHRYDLQGNLIDDFYITDFEPLEYEIAETYQKIDTITDDDGTEHTQLSEPIHKTARARCCKYMAGNDMEGLMTADGHVLTMPKYEYIIAVGPDTYLCTVSNDEKKIVNGKGQEVR